MRSTCGDADTTREDCFAATLRWRRDQEVHVEQVTDGVLLGRLEVVGEYGQPRRVHELLRLLADLDDVRVLGDRPEGIDVVARVPEDRGVPAQMGPLGMRVAVSLVVLGARDVEVSVESLVPEHPRDPLGEGYATLRPAGRRPGEDP
jgi:hypothetical protein